jgi:hypothetical protein
MFDGPLQLNAAWQSQMEVAESILALGALPIL